jgi:DHA2 family metal-tetracycline-proton antiporter-like MFS transporter
MLHMKTNPAPAKMMVLTLCFLVLLGVMNAVIFNVALPSIYLQLSLSPSEGSWIIVGYLIIIAIGSITYGKLADRFSIRTLLIIGIILFVAGSLLGFSSSSYGLLIAARILQASGGASFTSLALVSAARLLAPAARPKAISMIIASITLGSGLGPLIGGAVTNILGWSYLFLIMVVGVAGIGLVMKYVPQDKTEASPNAYHFDFIGALLLLALITSTLLAINMNKYLFILSVVLLYGCKVWMSKAAHPFIDIELFKNTKLLKLNAVGFIINFAITTILFLIPLLLASKSGMPPYLIGIVLFMGSLFGVFSSLLASKLVPSLGNLRMIYAASALMIFGLLTLGLAPNAPVIILAIALFFIYMGYSAIQVCLNIAIPQALHSAKIGVGLGLNNLISFVGMAVGPALSSRLFETTQSYTLIFSLAALLISCHFMLLFRISLVPQREN